MERASPPAVTSAPARNVQFGRRRALSPVDSSFCSHQEVFMWRNKWVVRAPLAVIGTIVGVLACFQNDKVDAPPADRRTAAPATEHDVIADGHGGHAKEATTL